MKKITTILLSLMLPTLTFALEVTPTNFVSKLRSITSGTTVNMATGTYTLSDANIIDFANAVSGKDNVTIMGSGTVTLKASNTFQQLLQFENCDGLLVQNVILYNLKLSFRSCTNSIMDNVGCSYVHFDTVGVTDWKGFGKAQSILAFAYGDNCVMKNCTINYTNSQVNIKIVKSYRGTNHKFINNRFTGRMQSAYEIWSASDQPASVSGLVQGGYYERISPNEKGGEDHCIYLHDLSGYRITGVETKGWSTAGSGHGIKIKGCDKVEIDNCYIRSSGIILRLATGWAPGNRDIWIHDNHIYGGDINSWTNLLDGYNIKSSCVIEQNTIYNGTVVAKTEDPNQFNAYNGLAEKNGGIYNNCTQRAIEIKSGINESGNDIGCVLDGRTNSIYITSPLNGETITTGTTINVSADALGSSYHHLSCYIDGVWKAQDLDAPYTFSISGLTVGTHAIKVSGQLNTDMSWVDSEEVIIDVDYATETNIYEAESAILAEGVVVATSQTGYSGTGFVDYPSSKNGYVEWTVNSIAEEVADFFFRYGNGTSNDRTLEISVNGSVITSSLSFPGNGDWAIWQDTETVSAKLNVGSNTIRATAINNYGPNIDNLQINTLKSATSANEIEADNSVSVYPNPFTSALMIQAEGYTQIVIMDVSGKVLINRLFEKETSLSLSYAEAPAGLYIIKLISASDTKTLKVIRK